MNRTSLDTPITTTVAALSDRYLLQRVKELSAIEHYVQGVVIDHLREVERRGLYLALGFSGMFDYVRELGYSTGAAWRRLKAMRLCEEVKGARGRLLEGTLTLDAAAQLQHAFERQERKARRSTTPDTDTHGGGGHEAQADAGSATPVMEPAARTAVAPGGPAPDVAARDAGPEGSAGAPGGLVPDAPVRAPERPVAPVLDAAERESLVAQAAGKSTRQVKEMLAKVDPELARAADRMRPLGAGRWELKAVIDDDCQVGLEQLKGLLSHVDPQMTLGQLLGRVVREALDRHDPSRPPRGRGRRRRTPEVAAQTSAPKTAAGPGAATAAQQSGMPAGSATSAPNVPADAGQRRVTVAKWPAVTTRTADVTAETSAPKEAATAPRTELPAGSATSPTMVQAADRPAAGAGIATSPPKSGGGAPPAAQRSDRLVTPATAPPQPRVRSRAIPVAVRRQVWERDRGCCSYVDRGSGRRCGSRHLLEIDHVVPYALGGSAEPDNLRLLCAAHHRYRHAARAHQRPLVPDLVPTWCLPDLAQLSYRNPATHQARQKQITRPGEPKRGPLQYADLADHVR